MRVTTIEYEQLFPTGVYANQRYRVIGTIEEGDEITDCFKYLKEKVEKTFVELNPQIQWSEHDEKDKFIKEWNQPIEKSSQKENLLPPKESVIQSHIKTINECKTLNNLKIFEKLVHNSKDEDLSQAYMKKYQELSPLKNQKQ